MANQIGVGIIGASADRAWGTRAHIPAIHASPDFVLKAVSTSRRESAQQASAAFGVPGYDDYHRLIAQPDVELVVVAVKVPHHRELVSAAIEAGKAVLCEWPLGNGLAEAEQLTAQATAAGVRNFIGLQARSSPGVQYVRQLVRDGYVGEVLSTSVIGSGGSWGPTVAPADAYLLDIASGASLLTIPFGHTLDAVGYCLGQVESLVASTATRRPTATEEETGRSVPITVADQVVLAARLTSAAVSSVHYRGGMSAGTNFLWEINGTEGDLVITADSGHIQMAPLTIRGARHGSKLASLTIPDALHWAPPGTPEGFPLNVGQAYALMAQDLRDGGHRAPSFADALHLHRTLAAIERAAGSGARQSL